MRSQAAANGSLETISQGNAFRIAIRAAWNNAEFDRGLHGRSRAMSTPIPWPSASLQPLTSLDLGATLDAYLMALVSNLTSAAIRLSVIGQTDSQRIIMEALPAIRGLAAFAAHATIDDVGWMRLPLGYRIDVPRDPTDKAVPHMTRAHNGPLRVGIGGPVGSGKTSLMEALCRQFHGRYDIVAITNDIYTKEDAAILTRSGALPESSAYSASRPAAARTPRSARTARSTSRLSPT